MVANPYPPQLSAGTTRVLRFLRYLPALGWDTTVLAAAAAGDVPAPPGQRVVRAPALVPSRLQRPSPRINRVNRWLFVPDNFAPWIGPAVATGRRLLRDEPFDAVFSSQPRASAHLVAAALRRPGIPWLADYRDPWATYQFSAYPTAAHRAAQFRLEARALRKADAVTAINGPIVADLVSRHPWLEGRTHVVPNGFDPDLEPEAVELGEGLWLVHTGRIYGREAQVSALFRAAADLPADVRLLFVGLDESLVRPLARRCGADDRLHVVGPVSLARSVGYQRAAHGLLLINGLRPEAMSSKVFEYLHAGRPVFAVSPRGSAARELFAETGGVQCAALDEDVGAALAAFVAALREDRAPKADPGAVERYRADELTRHLAQVLDELVEAGVR